MNRISTAADRRRKEVATAWGLIAPALIIMLIFTVYPVLRSVYLSLTKYRMGMEAPEFIAFDNFARLFRNATFWKVMRNTAVFAIYTVIPSMVLGLALALLVNRKGRHIGFIRTSYFYPSVMPMIAIASVWMFIYMARNGLFDQIMIAVGVGPLNVLSNKDTVLPAMAVMYVWREAGYLMVFFLSGLQSINTDVLEAVLTLPQKYRDVVYLHYYEGYPVPEIGQLLGKNVNTIYIYMLLTRARKLLREKLGGDWYEG